MNRLLQVFIIGGVAGLASCAHIAPPQIVKSSAVPSPTNAVVFAPLAPECYLPYSPSEYKLAVGDLVEVSVFGFADTIAAIPIAPDGRLYYMFGDGVQAAGRKPEEVAHDIQGRLVRLFNNPRVTILPKSFAATQYLVLGKVQNPGTFPLTSAITIQQAIANAGGLAQGIYRGTTIELASLRDSYMIRDGKRIPIDFYALMNKHDPVYDIYVRPGDLIQIASGLGSTREVYLLGEVAEQKTIGYRDNLTLIELLAGSSDRAGGYTTEANLSRVVILRGALENPQVFDVDVAGVLRGKVPDVYLMPGDLVYVPSKPFRFARDLTRAFVLTFVRSFSAEAGGRFVVENIFPATSSSASVNPGAGSSSTATPVDQTAPDNPPK
jgi:polysaccharide export outer membrane protein